MMPARPHLADAGQRLEHAHDLQLGRASSSGRPGRRARAGSASPALSCSLTSARTRRASAAFSSAAWRCSGVSVGGSGMWRQPPRATGRGRTRGRRRRAPSIGRHSAAIGPERRRQTSASSAAATSSPRPRPRLRGSSARGHRPADHEPVGAGARSRHPASRPAPGRRVASPASRMPGTIVRSPDRALATRPRARCTRRRRTPRRARRASRAVNASRRVAREHGDRERRPAAALPASRRALARARRRRRAASRRRRRRGSSGSRRRGGRARAPRAPTVFGMSCSLRSAEDPEAESCKRVERGGPGLGVELVARP